MKQIFTAIGYAIAGIIVILMQSIKKQISFMVSFIRFIFFLIVFLLFIYLIFNLLSFSNLIIIIFLFEVVLKILWLRNYKKPVFILSQPQNHDFLDLEKFNSYTIDLEKLGFVQLMDCSLASAPTQVMGRFLVHPQEYCFAEIYQIKNMPVFYSISSHLEQNWSLIVSIAQPNATSYVFSSQSKNLIKHINDINATSPSILFDILLQWRPKILSKLDINCIQDTSAECHIRWQEQMIQAKKNTLLKKSMILSLIEIIRFNSNPKTEWLGEYKKLRKKS